MPKKGKRKATRRSRVLASGRRRYSQVRQSKKAQFAGRNASNLAVGSALISGTSRVIGPQTARLGLYAQPANLIIAGLAGTYVFKSGQKDLISSGIKIAGSRLITTSILPRLEGMAPSIATRTTTARRTIGGYI